MEERERQGSGAWAVAGHPATEERATTKGHGRQDSGGEMQTGCGARSGSHRAPEAAKQRGRGAESRGAARTDKAPGRLGGSGGADRRRGPAGNKAAPWPRARSAPRGSARRARRPPPRAPAALGPQPPASVPARPPALTRRSPAPPPRRTGEPRAGPAPPRRRRPRPVRSRDAPRSPGPPPARGPSGARNFPGPQHSLAPSDLPCHNRRHLPQTLAKTPTLARFPPPPFPAPLPRPLPRPR